MLMDTLGIIIAFSSIMLLFSLLVTSLVHFIQGVLCLRFRVVEKGVLDLFEYLWQGIADKKTVVQCSNLLFDKTTLEGRLRKKSAYVSIDDIKDIFHSVPLVGEKNALRVLSEDEIERLEARVDKIFFPYEIERSQQFKKWMVIISIIVSFFVCSAFQINSVDLLRKISLRSETAQQISSAPKPLAALAVGGQQAQLGVSSFAFYHFRLFPHGIDFYYPKEGLYKMLNNWVGLFISTIFISLGAPFWFDALQKLFRLRGPISSVKLGVSRSK